MRLLLLSCFVFAGCGKSDPAPKSEPESKANLLSRTVDGVDWPGFLGPNRDGTSPEKGILTKWPKEGLKILWEAQTGLGYAPPTVSKGRCFHFDRFGDTARLSCRNAENGKLLWKFEYPTEYDDLYGYSPGPRACPIVDDDRVYIYGAEGMLHCLNVANGELLWKVDTFEANPFHQNFFGVGSVPLVEGDLLIVAIGGSPDAKNKANRPTDLREAKPNGSAIVAFDKKTGKLRYKSGDELASYASPIITTLNGKRTGLYFARGGLLGFEPATGKIEFHYKWRAKSLESVNAANPVVVNDQVLVTECYEKGAALVKIKNSKVEEVWTDAEREKDEKALMCHWNTPIHHEGYVYGSSGRHENEAQLRCVELATGNVVWTDPKPRLPRSSLTMIDGHFLCLTERGELLLLKVNPKKFDLVAKWEVQELDYPSWASPVVSRGLLYLRGKSQLICAELIPEKK